MENNITIKPQDEIKNNEKEKKYKIKYLPKKLLENNENKKNHEKEKINILNENPKGNEHESKKPENTEGLCIEIKIKISGIL